MSRLHRRTPGRSRARGSADFRRERVEHLLLEELRSLVRDQVRDPGLQGLVLLRLDLSPDGRHARVAYAAQGLPAEEDGCLEHRTRAALEGAHGFLRARLATSLDRERLPQLRFTFVGAVRPADTEEGGEPCLA